MVNSICTILTILSFLKSFFDGYDTCCKHAHYFFSISIQAVKKFFIYVVCSLEKFKPIKRFVAFLLCDSQLVYKIHLAFSRNCFTMICANGCARTLNLICYVILMLLLIEIVLKFNYPNGKAMNFSLYIWSFEFSMTILLQ